MARLARTTVLGFPHHVVQRGYYNQTVFEDESDYRWYLSRLQDYSLHYGLEIWAYCLMSNHVHFICVPTAEGALARIFNTLHMRYAQYHHVKKNTAGHLWKDRFLSCMLDKKSVFEEIRHIENNPVRDGLVLCAVDYPWSSARPHVCGEMNPLLSDDCSVTREIQDWRAYLADKADGSILARTRGCLKTGRPSGEDEFIHDLEEITGRKMIANPRGRPRKVGMSKNTFRLECI
jgi:putative transposase